MFSLLKFKCPECKTWIYTICSSNLWLNLAICCEIQGKIGASLIFCCHWNLRISVYLQCIQYITWSAKLTAVMVIVLQPLLSYNWVTGADIQLQDVFFLIHSPLFTSVLCFSFIPLLHLSQPWNLTCLPWNKINKNGRCVYTVFYWVAGEVRNVQVVKTDFNAVSHICFFKPGCVNTFKVTYSQT